MSVVSGPNSEQPVADEREAGFAVGLIHGGAASRAEDHPERGTSGATQAAITFAEALLRHSEGRPVHRFIPWSPALNIGPDREKRRSDPGFPITELPGRLRAGHYLCLHNTAQPVMDFTSQFRHRHSPRPVPVSSVQYAVSYSRQIHDIFVRAALSDLRSYDAFICPTRCAARAVERLLEHTTACLEEEFGLTVPEQPRCAVIPFGVDLEVFRPREKAPTRRELGLPEDGLLILCVGRFTPSDKMDLQPLLLAFRRVRATTADPSLRLVLAGPDPGYGSRMLDVAGKMGLAGSVILKSNLPSVAMPLLYAAADIFVFPADNAQETFGLALLEAAASGLPAVAADWDGLREIVQPGQTGFLVPTLWADSDDILEDVALASLAGSGALDHLRAAQSVVVDIAALEKYLRLLVEQPEVRERMGAAARERAVEGFGWQGIIDAHWALWEELHAQAAAAPPRTPRGSHLRQRLFQHFGHYATDHLRDEDEVRTTSHGRAVLKRKEEALMYAGLESLLNRKAVLAALLSLRWAERVRMPMTVASLLSCIEGIVPDRCVGRMHLLWMLKYDLLERLPGKGRGAALPAQKAAVPA